jgi:hypothetical protein
MDFSRLILARTSEGEEGAKLRSVTNIPVLGFTAIRRPLAPSPHQVEVARGNVMRLAASGSGVASSRSLLSQRQHVLTQQNEHGIQQLSLSYAVELETQALVSHLGLALQELYDRCRDWIKMHSLAIH